MVNSPLDQGSVALKSTLFLAAIVVVLAGVKTASPILVPFMLASFIAIICSPLVDLLTRYRVPKVIAIIGVICLVFAAGTSLATIVASSINDFTRQLPLYQAELVQRMSLTLKILEEFNIILSADMIREQLNPSRFMGLATNIISGLGGLMTNMLLLILTVVFMLIESDSFSKKIHHALHDPEMRLKQIDQFLDSVKSYLAIKTLISLATGFICGLGLYFIGVDYFILWGIVAFLLNYIPNIGSVIAAIPPVLLAFLQFGPSSAALVAGIYISTNMVMGSVLEPKLMGRTLGLSTLVVFLSLIFWGWLLGPVGMLLSVPLTMIVKIALEAGEHGTGFAVLLSAELPESDKNKPDIT